MNVSDFDYELPQELIAQDPLEDRSSSRLLVLNKESGEFRHDVFYHIVDELNPGDCLVINDTKVIPARLYGVKEGTGAGIEVLLLKRKENDIWETLVKPGKKAKPGTVIWFGDGKLKGTVVDVVEEGNRLIQFSYEGIFEEVLDELGQMSCRPTLHMNCRTKLGIRRYMRSTKDLRLHLRQDFTLRRTCLPRLRRRESISRELRFTWDSARFAR